jgi:hypothetical protein
LENEEGKTLGSEESKMLGSENMNCWEVKSVRRWGA